VSIYLVTQINEKYSRVVAMTAFKAAASQHEVLAPGTILIAGGGPVGLLLAAVLSHFGTKSVICERNKTTTKWPKMDLTNGRSMEILRRLGLADALRERGVPSHIPQPVLFSSGLSQESAFTKWELPSVDQFREMIKEKNDGSMPREAWQRVSQVIFERWLKELCDKDPNIDVRFGIAVQTVEETDGGVSAETKEIDSGDVTTIHADYVAGCDGANSKTRQSMGMPLDGGPM
jgi:FAD-dependent monooxygenase